MNAKELLMKLSSLDGPSGFEEPVVEEIKKVVEPLADEVRTTKHGSLVVLKRGTGKGKIAVFSHVDEIGFVVAKVDGEYARLEPIGGVDPKVIYSSKVKVYTRNGVGVGVIGMLEPHLQSQEYREKFIGFDEILLDLSLVEGQVRVGDLAVIQAEPLDLNGKVAGKALDNRSSCVALIGALELLNKYKHALDVFFVFSTHEEVGGIGALTSAYSIEPDYAVIVDVTHAEEPPQFDHIRLGKGPVVVHGPVVDKAFTNRVKEIARKNGVSLQEEAVGGRSGTETDLVQIVRRGIKTALVSIPLKFMHTPVEVVDPKDVEETARLIALVCSELEV